MYVHVYKCVYNTGVCMYVCMHVFVSMSFPSSICWAVLDYEHTQHPDLSWFLSNNLHLQEVGLLGEMTNSRVEAG